MSSKLGLFAKKTLEEYVSVIDAKLVKFFEEEIGKSFGFNERQKKVVKDELLHAMDHNLRKSKRLRASLVKYGYLLGGDKEIDYLVNAEMSVELVHTALLMQDDIQDQDSVRRGGPTTHKFFQNIGDGDLHYGEGMAMDLSDSVLCIGFELLLNSGFPMEQVKLALGQFLRGVTNTAFGQAYDVTLEKFGEWNEDDVIVLHRAKTAIYTYENPLFIGAHLAKLPNEAFEILHDYAMKAGVAFQLQDDILGVYGDEEKTGKSADSDLKQGKCTLLVLKVFQNGNEKQKMAIRKVWGKFDEANQDDLIMAKQAIKESGAYEYSKIMASEYAAEGAKIAEKLRSLNLNSEAIDYIQGIAEYMVTREV